jgi:F0F1-type ATP synthase epsilon subunit
MAHTIHVDVVSAEEQIFSGEAEFVVLPESTASSASIRATRRS